ncbi:HAD family hydrolase [Thermodesulfobacteriota bacterium]
MNNIKALGFDLFNTLISAEPKALEEAIGRLIRSFQQNGLEIELETFQPLYREAALGFFEEARRSGKETHNRFWISAALQRLGYDIPPDDTRIAQAVEKYFTAFLDYCRLIPGTLETLRTLKANYPLGLLSNFTDDPAAMAIIDHMGLTPFFDVVLISGGLGYRKPHPLVFDKLVEGLNVAKDQIMFVGDDPDSDVGGAHQAGLQPVWTTCVRDQNIESVAGPIPLPEEFPDSDVPRISNWQDLLDLLEL